MFLHLLGPFTETSYTNTLCRPTCHSPLELMDV